MKQLYFLFSLLFITHLTHSQTAEVSAPFEPGSPTGNSLEVGVTKGELSVTLTGGSNYSIPISVPPGINNVAPEINLVYNSQSSNGLAGLGWNISGVSVITRVSSTMFHDGKIDAVDFDNLDRFALDGQRLVIKNGTSGGYGLSGSVYETENYSNIKITSYGVHPNGTNFGPEYFTVEYPDGSKAYYGSNVNSRTINDWAITYWENAQGVRINYSYTAANNNLSISSIKYGTTGNNPSINEIQFVYKNRLRPESAYINGYNFIKNVILSEVKVLGSSTGFRNYYLAHTATDMGYERLSSITEKNGDNSKSYNPTVFNYEYTPTSIAYSSSNTNLTVSNIRIDNSAIVSGDYDGDGKLDFILYPNTGSGSKSSYYLFNNIKPSDVPNFPIQHNTGKFENIFPVNWLGGSATYGYKLMPNQGWAVTKLVNNSQYSFSIYAKGSTGIQPQYDRTVTFPTVQISTASYCGYDQYEQVMFPKKTFSGDFNGDGLTDVLVVDSGDISYREYRETPPYDECVGSTITLSSRKVYFIDLKRDNPNYFNLAGELSTYIGVNSKIDIADVNGDGKTDLLVFDQGALRVYSLNENNQIYQVFAYVDPYIRTNLPALLGDYNGDGKMDFIIPDAENSTLWHKYIATGASFVRTSQEFNGLIYSSSFLNLQIRHWIATDYDNDGKADLINISCSRYGDDTYGFVTVECYYNKNETFKRTSGNYSSTSSGNQAEIDKFAVPIFFTPLQSNKGFDIAFINNNKIHLFESQKNTNKEKLLKHITTGNGLIETISYKPLDDLSESDTEVINFYKPSTGVENYPNFDIKNSSTYHVVSKIEKRSQTSYAKQVFAYHGAVSNVEGLGFLGFRNILKTNWFNDDEPITSYVTKYDVQKRGTVLEEYSARHIVFDISLSPTDYIVKSTMSYDSQLLSNKVFKIKNTSSTSFNSLDSTSKEITTTYDSFNYPLTSVSKTKLGNAIKESESVTISYEAPLSSPYIIGLPKQKNVETTINPGQADQDVSSSEEQFFYNPNHLVSQIKKKAHNTEYIIESNEYDAYANIIQKKLTVPNLEPRITSFQYDSSGRFLTKKTNVDGSTNQYTYNSSTGLLTTETNPYGLVTTYNYDSWGKKIKMTDYLGKNITYQYNWIVNSPFYYYIFKVNEDNSLSISHFDDLDREILKGENNVNGSWSYIKTNYDIYDRPISVSEPYISISSGPSLYTTTKYDEYGRILKITEPTGKINSFSYSGLTTTISDGIKTTIKTRDAIDKLISSTDNGGTINYKYYAHGGIKEANYDGVKTFIEYDGWGRKTKLTDPSAGIHQYEYNLFGETTKEITPKGKSIYFRDNFGRIYKTEIETNDGTAPYYYYEYNADGSLANITTDDYIHDDYQSIEIYEYDNFKRQKKIIYGNSTSEFTKELTYDSFGRIEKEKQTAKSLTNNKTSTKTFRYTYKNGDRYQILDDASNQILWTTDSVNERGQLTQGTFGNGLTQSNTYNQYGFPSAFETKNQTGSLFNFTTNFDPIRGNLSNRSNSLFNTYEPFEYDNQDRLVKWNKEIVSIINTNFNAGTEEFGTQFGATTANQNGQLKVTATQAYAGVKKTLLTQAKIGDKLTVKVKVDKGTTNKVRVLIVEYNPANGAGNESFIGYAQNGIIEFEHTVSQYPYITLNIDKDGTGNDVGTATNFYVDDLWVGKMITETQQYDERGRITENNLGQYNYTDTNKAYQNTSIDLNPETDVYYKNREGLFNDGMEEQKGWSDLGLGWEIFTKPVYDDSKSKTGKYSLKLYNPTTSLKSVHTDKWIPISNTATTQYTYSGWVYSDGPDAQIQFFMKKDGEPEYYTNVDNYFVGTKNQWVYVEKTFNVPAYITKLNIRLDNNGPGNVWFDDIRIKKTTNPATSLRELNIVYSMFKKPLKIEETGVDKVSFKYNPDQFRTTMYYGGLQNDMTQRQFRKNYSYDGSAEIITNNTSGESTFIFFVGGNAYDAPVVYKDNGTVQEYLYLHRDYQGSILAISNQTGNIVEKRLFDPWGNIVKVQDGQSNNLQGLTVLDRGYTGHEHIQSIGIINMNGRLYDPKLHRFLSPDNYVSDAFDTQSYNRFGYAWNNPLKFSDPSGEIAPLIIVGAAIIGAYFGGVAANGSWNPTKWNWSSSDTWVGIIGGAAIGGVSAGVGAAVTATVAAKIGIGGFAGGFISGAIGGSVGGFISGFGTAMLPGGGGNPLSSGFKAAVFGGIFGGVINGVFSGASSATKGDGFWTGAHPKANAVSIQPKDVVRHQTLQPTISELQVQEAPLALKTPAPQEPLSFVRIATTDGKMMAVRSDLVAAKGGGNLPTSSLNPTHYITKSKTQMQALLNDIRANGIQESIKYVEHDGVKYIVDGHHRFYAAQRLGIQNIPVQQVQLPHGGYKGVMDLIKEPGKQPGFWKFMK